MFFPYKQDIIAARQPRRMAAKHADKPDYTNSCIFIIAGYTVKKIVLTRVLTPPQC
jgi:hypothetical protein